MAGPVVPRPTTKRFALNLALIGLVGVGASGWLLYYTDIFPEVVTLLSLGGLFSWLAFVSKALPEERLKQLQGLLFGTFIDNWPATGAYCLVAAALLCYADSRATIKVESLRDAADRTVSIELCASAECQSRVDEAQPPQRLPPGGSVKKLVRSSHSQPATYRVKASGYPDRLVTLKPWDREELYVPSSFHVRPVVLLYPESTVIDDARNAGLTLFVTIKPPEGTNSQAIKREVLFDGRALWIGCDEDVEMPENWKNLFAAELASEQKDVYARFLNYPKPLGSERIDLRGGERISALLGYEDNADTAFATAPEIVVAKAQGRSNFPQVKVLRSRQ